MKRYEVILFLGTMQKLPLWFVKITLHSNLFSIFPPHKLECELVLEDRSVL